MIMYFFNNVYDNKAMTSFWIIFSEILIIAKWFEQKRRGGSRGGLPPGQMESGVNMFQSSRGHWVQSHIQTRKDKPSQKKFYWKNQKNKDTKKIPPPQDFFVSFP